MIKLGYDKIESVISFDNTINTVVFENPQNFAIAVQELNSCMADESDGFKISNDGELIKFSQISELLINYFDFSSSCKKLNTILNKIILAHLQRENETINELYAKGYNVLQDVVNPYDYTVSINENCDINSFIKLYGLSILIDEDNLLSRLIDFVNIVSELSKVRILILVSIKSYLSKDELSDLVKHCAYKEIKLLCIEPYDSYRLTEEKILVIDNDYCEIIVQ